MTNDYCLLETDVVMYGRVKFTRSAVRNALFEFLHPNEDEDSDGRIPSLAVVSDYAMHGASRTIRAYRDGVPVEDSVQIGEVKRMALDGQKLMATAKFAGGTVFSKSINDYTLVPLIEVYKSREIGSVKVVDAFRVARLRIVYQDVTRRAMVKYRQMVKTT